MWKNLLGCWRHFFSPVSQLKLPARSPRKGAEWTLEEWLGNIPTEQLWAASFFIQWDRKLMKAWCWTVRWTHKNRSKPRRGNLFGTKPIGYTIRLRKGKGFGRSWFPREPSILNRNFSGWTSKHFKASTVIIIYIYIFLWWLWEVTCGNIKMIKDEEFMEPCLEGYTELGNAPGVEGHEECERSHSAWWTKHYSWPCTRKSGDPRIGSASLEATFDSLHYISFFALQESAAPPQWHLPTLPCQIERFLYHK